MAESRRATVPVLLLIATTLLQATGCSELPNAPSPEGQRGRYNSGPPAGLVRATMLSQAQDYQAHGEPCAAYGARMESAITNSSVDMTKYAISSPSYALGTSNPNTGQIQISEHHDTQPPLLNPRTNFEM